MKKYFLFAIIIISSIATSCSPSGILSINYTKPYITVSDQFNLKLGMNENEVRDILGYPMEISVGQDSSKSITYTMWTYFLRYPVYYPGFSPAGSSNLSVGKARVTDQMLKGSTATAYAEEQEHKLIFINRKLVAFGNKSEISSISLFSLEPLKNESE